MKKWIAIGMSRKPPKMSSASAWPPPAATCAGQLTPSDSKALPKPCHGWKPSTTIATTYQADQDGILELLDDQAVEIAHARIGRRVVVRAELEAPDVQRHEQQHDARPEKIIVDDARLLWLVSPARCFARVGDRARRAVAAASTDDARPEMRDEQHEQPDLGDVDQRIGDQRVAVVR